MEAIDDLLATPELDAPVKLLRPRVLYEFADPDLETRSAGQKILLRMGPENAARVKASFGRPAASYSRWRSPLGIRASRDYSGSVGDR